MAELHFSVPGRVESIQLRGHDFFIKRDDLIDPLLSGNKYYKLYRLIHTPAEELHTLRSWGGSQSNAMLAIAALCHRKGWCFEYTTRNLPKHLKSAPTGNLKTALDLGMQLHEMPQDRMAAAITAMRCDAMPGCLSIAQGGADPMALEGIHHLAESIEQWRLQMGFEQLNLVTPSGTGTTASYLARSLPHLSVLTTPLVADRNDLIAQISQLMPLPDNLNILDRGRRYRFAQPEAAFLLLYEELRSTGITFDLIYGVPMWHTLLRHLDHIEGPILYLHSGGLTGNATMLDRYRQAK